MSTISITTYDRRSLRRPAVAAPVRLTRRGRLVLVLAIIAALAVGAVVLGSSWPCKARGARPSGSRSYEVQAAPQTGNFSYFIFQSPH